MVAAVLSVLLKVRVSVEVPPAVMVAGLKDLLSEGATVGVTVSVATAAEAQLPLLVWRPPAAMELT
jgi:copper(I)-binding protein